MNCRDVSTLSPLYVSGELVEARATLVAEHVAKCVDCARELERQKEMDALLRDGVLAEDLDTTALESRVHEQIAESSVRQRPLATRWLALGAAMALLMLAAGLAYRALWSPKIAPVYADAARDHRLEVIYKQPRRWLADPEAIETLAQQQGLAAPAVSGLVPAGYRPAKGKLCRLDGRLFLHLVYSDGAHEFSLYLRRGDAGPLPGDPRESANGKLLYAVDVAGEHLSCFHAGALTTLVVTGQSGDTALQLARFVAGVL